MSDEQLAEVPDNVVEAQAESANTPENNKALETPETSEPQQDEKQEGDVEATAKEPKPKEQKPELSEAEKIKYAMQKRIDRQTAKTAQMERELVELRQRIEQSTPAQRNNEPQESDFETTEEYLIAKGKYQATQEYEAKKAKEKQDAEAAEYAAKVAKIKANFEAKETEFRKTTPDYDEAVAVVNDYVATADPKSTHIAVFRDFVMDSDNPAPLLYKLGKDPDLIEEMMTMSPIRFAKALVKMELELESAPKATVTKTAAPPSPVKGASAGKKDLSEMSYAEMKKMWKL